MRQAEKGRTVPVERSPLETIDGAVAFRAAVGTALVAAVVLLSGCGAGQAEEAAPAVQTATAERRDLRITAEATGSVEPIRVVEVKSKAAGEILNLGVDIGDQVEPGALLAEIEPRDVRNAYNQAQADLDVAQARMEISRAQLKRAEELLDAGVITQEEYETRNLDYANARAALVKAETNLELAEDRLGDVTIQAPMAGTILQKNVEEGQVITSAQGNVSGGTTLFIMANLEEMQVRTLVDETDMGSIQAGMPANVRVEAYQDRVFQGDVEKVEPQAVVQQNVTMFPVIVRLDNRARLLKPGMNAEVEILVAEAHDALTVPNNTVVEPREVTAAAEVLGMDPQSIQLDRQSFAELQGGMEGDGVSSAEGAAPGSSPRARFQEIRAKVQSGEISRDSAQAIFASLRERGGAMTPGARAPGSQPGAVGAPTEGRPAVAFVVGPDGRMEARAILLGLSDWDHAQVLAGLEEGERVALIGAAQLQAQQEEFLNRVRERRGGPF